MTTHNLNTTDIDAAIKAAKKVADGVRQRRESVVKAIEAGSESEDQARDLEIAAAAVRQRTQDKTNELQEELGQLDNILGTNPAVPATPVAADASEEAPASEPAPEPEPEPTLREEAPASEPEPVTQTQTTAIRVVDIWHDSPIWVRVIIILAALLGAFVFMLIARVSLPIIHWGTDDWWSWLAGVAAFLWQAGLIVGGFGLGGWWAARWFHRRSH